MDQLEYTSTVLAPIDIVALLKICARMGKPWSQRDIAYELQIGQSSLNRALKNAEELLLYNPVRKQVSVMRLEDALVHGAPYFLAPKWGGEARGVPTSWAAPPLSDLLAVDDPLIPVWPDPNGEVRGIALEPLHKNVPQAARKDPLLYEMLALVDALREGRAREMRLAQKELHRRLNWE